MLRFTALIVTIVTLSLILGCNASTKFVQGIDSEIEQLQQVRDKLEGKSVEELVAMIDTNGDGRVTKNELKNFLVTLTGAELDDIGNAEIDVLWNKLGLEETINVAEAETNRVFPSSPRLLNISEPCLEVLNQAVQIAIPIATVVAQHGIPGAIQAALCIASFG